LGLKGDKGSVQGSAGLRGGRNQSWTDSDIGIASEDRSRMVGALRQIAESENWSTTREGFLRETSSSSEALVSSSAAGLTTSLTEAQSYTVEARRAEELASRLENQASWYESATAAGSLNLSQAYREWGMAEIEANRDYYGPVHFDDIGFQMSAQGQQLQARFVESYADRLHGEIADELVLPPHAPVSRPSVSSAGDVLGSVKLGGPPGALSASSDVREDVQREVARVQERGEQRVDRVTDYLEGRTRDARGASAEAADDVKEW